MWRGRIVVCPASTPTPKRSQSNTTVIGFVLVGIVAFVPKRVWRALSHVCPLWPNSSSNAGSLEGRLTSNQSGLLVLKSLIMSPCVNP